MEIKILEEKAKRVRRKVLEMIYRHKTSHVGSAFSMVEMLVALYSGVLKVDPENPRKKGRDIFILSKGHGCSALYATLALAGFFPEKNLDDYSADKDLLPGHPTLSVPGVEAVTGSLGHGLPIGIGMAMGQRLDGEALRVYVLMGDGECSEGSVWEGALFAARMKLDNLVGIVDSNKLHGYDKSCDILPEDRLTAMWRAAGWAVREIDGHSFPEVTAALRGIPYEKEKPSLIFMHTVKGKGVSFMENRLEWHYKSPSDAEYKKALEELA